MGKGCESRSWLGKSGDTKFGTKCDVAVNSISKQFQNNFHQTLKTRISDFSGDFPRNTWHPLQFIQDLLKFVDDFRLAVQVSRNHI